jgi:hypothetical protein
MASPSRIGASLGVLLGACGLLIWAAGAVHAQGTGGVVVTDSSVGYIDEAIPANLLRFRADAAFNNNRPTRAQFFYAPTPPRGPGLPLPESRVDYQDLSACAEVLLLPALSTFVEVPVRFLNPDINADTWGLADMNVGIKYALLDEQSRVVTLQLRTYVPTGDPHRGLGNSHASLEPAVLFLQGLGDRARLEGELRCWVPVGGDTFAGDIVRYGLGVSYDLCKNDALRLAPVVEVVGWTVLGGKESALVGSGPPRIQDAFGDTIVNAKLGLRLAVGDRVDFYAGWGRVLTGDRWYENIYRLEMRLHF